MKDQPFMAWLSIGQTLATHYRGVIWVLLCALVEQAWPVALSLPEGAITTITYLGTVSI